MRWASPGTMRHVLLTGRYAVKLPRIRLRTLRQEIAEGTLLEGFRANRQERRRWRRESDPRLCPVVAGDPLGIVLIMRQASPLTDAEFDRLLMLDLQEAILPLPSRFYHGDLKRQNYGALNGEIVRLDYGEPPRR